MVHRAPGPAAAADDQPRRDLGRRPAAAARGDLARERRRRRRGARRELRPARAPLRAAGPGGRRRRRPPDRAGAAAASSSSPRRASSTWLGERLLVLYVYPRTGRPGVEPRRNGTRPRARAAARLSPAATATTARSSARSAPASSASRRSRSTTSARSPNGSASPTPSPPIPSCASPTPCGSRPSSSTGSGSTSGSRSSPRRAASSRSSTPSSRRTRTRPRYSPCCAAAGLTYRSSHWTRRVASSAAAGAVARLPGGRSRGLGEAGARRGGVAGLQRAKLRAARARADGQRTRRTGARRTPDCGSNAEMRQVADRRRNRRGRGPDGADRIPVAGHLTGEGVSAQANCVERRLVRGVDALAAFEGASGPWRAASSPRFRRPRRRAGTARPPGRHPRRPSGGTALGDPSTLRVDDDPMPAELAAAHPAPRGLHGHRRDRRQRGLSPWALGIWRSSTSASPSSSTLPRERDRTRPRPHRWCCWRRTSAASITSTRCATRTSCCTPTNCSAPADHDELDRSAIPFSSTRRCRLSRSCRADPPSPCLQGLPGRGRADRSLPPHGRPCPSSPAAPRPRAPRQPRCEAVIRRWSASESWIAIAHCAASCGREGDKSSSPHGRPPRRDGRRRDPKGAVVPRDQVAMPRLRSLQERRRVDDVGEEEGRPVRTVLSGPAV